MPISQLFFSARLWDFFMLQIASLARNLPGTSLQFHTVLISLPVHLITTICSLLIGMRVSLLEDKNYNVDGCVAACKVLDEWRKVIPLVWGEWNRHSLRVTSKVKCFTQKRCWMSLVGFTIYYDFPPTSAKVGFFFS